MSPRHRWRTTPSRDKGTAACAEPVSGVLLFGVDSDRNVDLYHWSSAKFSSTWYDTLSVLVAKGRARVSVAASEADWSKRIREMQYADYEDHTVGS